MKLLTANKSRSTGYTSAQTNPMARCSQQSQVTLSTHSHAPASRYLARHPDTVSRSTTTAHATRPVTMNNQRNLRVCGAPQQRPRDVSAQASRGTDFSTKHPSHSVIVPTSRHRSGTPKTPNTSHLSRNFRLWQRPRIYRPNCNRHNKLMPLGQPSPIQSNNWLKRSQQQ